MVLSTLATFMVRGEITIRIVCMVSCVFNIAYFWMQPGDMRYPLLLEVTLFAVNAFYIMRDKLKDHKLDTAVSC